MFIGWLIECRLASREQYFHVMIYMTRTHKQSCRQKVGLRADVSIRTWKVGNDGRCYRKILPCNDHELLTPSSFYKLSFTCKERYIFLKRATHLPPVVRHSCVFYVAAQPAYAHLARVVPSSSPIWRHRGYLWWVIW